jgi:hypothetical protein
MKTGLIVLAVALGIVVGGFTYTMASIEGCLGVKETQQSEKIEFCQKYLVESIGIDDEF